jgi:hypothetical protein
MSPGLYRDPVVAAVTCRCDWRIRDLVEGARPATLTLVVPPSDISQTKPLVRLILNQIGRRLTEDLNAKGKRHRLLLMFDEFPERFDPRQTAMCAAPAGAAHSGSHCHRARRADRRDHRRDRGAGRARAFLSSPP